MKVKWKNQTSIDEEKQLVEQKRVEKKERISRTNTNIKSANSIVALRAIVNDIAIELGIIERSG